MLNRSLLSIGKAIEQKCYEKCDIGKDDPGRQRVIDICTDISSQVCAILTTAELDYEMDWVSPVHLPHDQQG